MREMESASKIFQCLLAKFNTVVESDFVTLEISKCSEYWFQPVFTVVVV